MSDYRPDIWRLQAQRDIDGLIKALADEDASIRKRAAVALRAIEADSAVPALTAALANENDPETRAHIVAAIEQLSEEPETTPETQPEPSPEQSRVAQLIGALGSPQPEQIIAAVQELSQSKEKLAVVPLVMLFNNPKTPIKVRLAVAEGLLQLESAPVEVSLLGALRSPNWQTRRNSAAILGQLKADWAIEPLGKALDDDHEQVRRTAFAALKHIATPEALKALRVPRKPLPAQPPAAPEPPKPAPPKPIVGGKAALTSALENALKPKPAPDAPKPQPEVKAPSTPTPPQAPAAKPIAAPPVVQKPEEKPAAPPTPPTPPTPESAKPSAPPTLPESPTSSAEKPASVPQSSAATSQLTSTAPLEASEAPTIAPILAPPTLTPQTPPAMETKAESAPAQIAEKPAETETDSDDAPSGELPKTGRLAWPKKKPANVMPSLAPTRPLDPRTLEQARQRMMKNSSSDQPPDDEA